MPDLSLTMIVAVIVVIYLLSSIKILAEYERGVIFRLGRVLPSPRGQASSWCSSRSTGWCGFPYAPRQWRFPHRTW